MMKKCVIWLVFKIGQRSAISFKRSRRELSCDVAEHRSILKNDGVMRNLVSLRDMPTFSRNSQKVSARAFQWCGSTLVMLKDNQNTLYPGFSSYPKQESNLQNGGSVFTVICGVEPRVTSETIALPIAECLKEVRKSLYRLNVQSCADKYRSTNPRKMKNSIKLFPVEYFRHTR